MNGARRAMAREALLRPESGFSASFAAEPLVRPWLGLMTRSAWVANCVEIKPWSEAEEARALR